MLAKGRAATPCAGPSSRGNALPLAPARRLGPEGRKRHAAAAGVGAADPSPGTATECEMTVTNGDTAAAVDYRRGRRAGLQRDGIFRREVSRPGRRHPPGRQRPARRAGHRGLQCRRPRGPDAAVRGTPVRLGARLRRQLRVQAVRSGPGTGLADQRRRGAKPALADGAARRAAGTLLVRSGLLRRRRPRRLRRNRPDRSRSRSTAGRWWPARRRSLAADPTACILRISLPMGVSFSGHAGAIDWITSRFKKSRPATLYFDEIRTPTYTDCLNRLCERCSANELSGIFHAGGAGGG